MRTYRVKIARHGPKAKSKGTIMGRALPEQCEIEGFEYLIVKAENRDQAHARLSSDFRHEDKRPLAGKSNLRPDPTFILGDRVRLLRPYPVGWTEDGGHRVLARQGTITEVVTEDYYSVHPDGYENKFVDFTAGELEKA